jgi:acetyl esterase/lipase
MRTHGHLRRSALLVLLLAGAVLPASAQGGGWRPGMLRERLAARRANAGGGTRVVLPAGTRVVRDVAYGRDPRQRYDVYAPADARGAPVIFMVHGGGWVRGDKGMANMVQSKVARWVPRGFIVISTNYRLVPDVDPVEQARDVARAVAAAQRQAATWGGDRTRFVLMGHSAGAHLVALLSADPTLATAQGAAPWLGTVVLDGGTMDVAAKMSAPARAAVRPALRPRSGVLARGVAAARVEGRGTAHAAGVLQPAQRFVSTRAGLRSAGGGAGPACSGAAGEPDPRADQRDARERRRLHRRRGALPGIARHDDRGAAQALASDPQSETHGGGGTCDRVPPLRLTRNRSVGVPGVHTFLSRPSV